MTVLKITSKLNKLGFTVKDCKDWGHMVLLDSGEYYYFSAKQTFASALERINYENECFSKRMGR